MYPAVFALTVAHTVNAGGDMGAIAAGIKLLRPILALALVVPVGLILVAHQIRGSYRLIVTIFTWLSLDANEKWRAVQHQRRQSGDGSEEDFRSRLRDNIDAKGSRVG